MKSPVKFYLLLLFVIVVSSYYYSMAPSLVELDSGELATAQATLGIAHPTGYPLFTLLGYLFLKIPLPFSMVFRSNLLSLLWTLLSVIMFFSLVKLILTNLTMFANKKITEIIILKSETEILSISFLGTLIFAFSRTVWSQSTSVEVYSLHLILITSVLYFFFKAIIQTGHNEFKLNKSWFVFAVLLGLSMTNHLSTLYLFPGLCTLLFIIYGFKKTVSKSVLLFPFFLIPVILLNFALMLRSSQKPLLNWGNPSNITNLIYHITGLQFRGLYFSENNSPFMKSLYFLKSLSFNPVTTALPGGEFGLFILLAFPGIYYLYKISKPLAAMISIFFLTSLLSIFYRITDIDAYFLLSYLSVAISIVCGIIFIYIFIQAKKSKILLFSLLFSIAFVFQYISNYRQVSQHDVYIYEDFTNSVFNNIEPGAVIFCSDGDPFIATSYYYQFVEGKRLDITKIVTPFLYEPWYADWVDQYSPGIAVRKNQKTYININNKPVYFSLGVYNNDTLLELLNISKKDLIPDGMFFRWFPEESYMPTIFKTFPLRLTGRRTQYTRSIEEYIEIMMNLRARYELEYNHLDKAILILNAATKMKITINPSYWNFIPFEH